MIYTRVYVRPNFFTSHSSGSKNVTSILKNFHIISLGITTWCEIFEYILVMQELEIECFNPTHNKSIY